MCLPQHTGSSVLLSVEHTNIEVTQLLPGPTLLNSLRVFKVPVAWPFCCLSLVEKWAPLCDTEVDKPVKKLLKVVFVFYRLLCIILCLAYRVTKLNLFAVVSCLPQSLFPLSIWLY